LPVTDKHGTQEPERLVARVTVTTDPELLPAVVDFVGQVAHGLGLKDRAAEHLDRAVEAVCRNVIEHAFAADEEGRYDVEVLRRPGRVVIGVEDRGLPFDYAHLRNDGDTALPQMLRRSFADEMRFINLGRGGNRVELIKHMPHADVRQELPEDDHHVLRTPVAPEDTPLEIRMMRPEETAELSRCVYRSYGYSYDWDHIYYPDRIRELQESGLMRSCVAVTTEGDLVGHLAVRLGGPDSWVGEAGQAVVDPRFRGHRLFERMKTFLAERARDWGMYGLYSEATAVHPYSQKGNLDLGARETGFLLGYIPASVSYKEIGEDREGRRGSVALFYLRTNPEPERAIHPPAVYREAVKRVVEHNGLHRTEEDGSDAEMPTSSRISVDVRRDHNLAFLKVEEPGADLQELVRVRLRELCLHRVDCIYVDLPLSHPAVQSAGASLDELGFFFGGIIPELRDGDVLRLQYLNEVDIRPGDVRTGSDFGQELVSFIFEQKSIAER
jgi:anti-sigma regulatory factor (Ser/Thr protein kinase)/GNAT superfamily N-acetyltransferase